MRANWNQLIGWLKDVDVSCVSVLKLFVGILHNPPVRDRSSKAERSGIAERGSLQQQRD
jgi:hypothetical protein